MSEPVFTAALQAGRDHSVDDAGASGSSRKADLLIVGEMGIGNTTSAAALICALTGANPADVIGRGTGVDDQGLERKRKVVEQALSVHSLGGHSNTEQNPLEVLRRLGGLEITAMVAAYIYAAQRGIPSLVDGYIASAAALVACRINPGLRDWLLFSHQSAEAGHGRVLDVLQAKALLNAGLRLGEGSGAALAVPVLQLALALHNEMATFAEAGVSDQDC